MRCLPFYHPRIVLRNNLSLILPSVFDCMTNGPSHPPSTNSPVLELQAFTALLESHTLSAKDPNLCPCAPEANAPASEPSSSLKKDTAFEN